MVKTKGSYNGAKREGVIIKVQALRKGKKGERKTQRLEIKEVFLGKSRIIGFTKNSKESKKSVLSIFSTPFNIFDYYTQIKPGDKITCYGPYSGMGNSKKESFKNFMKKHGVKKGKDYRVIKIIHPD